MGCTLTLRFSRYIIMSKKIPSFTALVIDPNESSGRLLVARLADLGGYAVWISTRPSQYGIGPEGKYPDLIFFDPTPHRDVHRMAIDIRRACPSFVYLIALRDDPVIANFDKVTQNGTNLVLEKPVSVVALSDALDDARTLLILMRRLNDTTRDTKSGGGAIAKSAFAQLFLSSLDRADRYAEQSFILQVKILNLTQIRSVAGVDAAQSAAAALAHVMARLRRQSDILGAIDDDEYALMLQRPAYATEPTEAALRFADQLTDQNMFISLGLMVAMEMQITLIEIPTGHVYATHTVTIS